jgi:hypothetical protein
LGTHKLSGDNSTILKLATETYVLHPEYNPDTLENDIGLIKLRLRVTLTGKVISNCNFAVMQYFCVGNINQIYLPHNEITDSFVGTAYGWGQTSDGKCLG